MKTDKQFISDKTKSTSVQNNINGKYAKLITTLPLLAMLVVLLTSSIKHVSVTNITKQTVMILVLSGALTLYIQLNVDNILNKKFAKLIIVLGYLSSIFLLLVVPNPEMLSFWMIGGLVAAMLIDNRLGLLMQFNLAFVMGITLDVHPKMILQNLIICVLMSILADAMNNKATIIYSAIIILSINVTLDYVINNFVFDKIANVNYYYFSLFSIFTIIVTAFIISVQYHKFVGKENENEEVIELEGLKRDSVQKDVLEITSLKDHGTIESVYVKASGMAIDGVIARDSAIASESVTESDCAEANYNQNTKASYEVLCNMDNVLLKRLKEHSESLYLHSILISDISSRAAKEIGADELLAKAGGLYHEIGKITGKQYIEEGLKLAEEYAFPKELKAILKEHNIKYDKPNSAESTIVMLSDNVVSTIEYIEKTDDHKFTPNKIIENIFQMRLDKGTFDSAGISLKDYKLLKEFYQKEFNKTKEEKESI